MSIWNRTKVKVLSLICSSGILLLSILLFLQPFANSFLTSTQITNASITTDYKVNDVTFIGSSIVTSTKDIISADKVNIKYRYYSNKNKPVLSINQTTKTPTRRIADKIPFMASNEKLSIVAPINNLYEDGLRIPAGNRIPGNPENFTIIGAEGKIRSFQYNWSHPSSILEKDAYYFNKIKTNGITIGNYFFFLFTDLLDTNEGIFRLNLQIYDYNSYQGWTVPIDTINDTQVHRTLLFDNNNSVIPFDITKSRSTDHYLLKFSYNLGHNQTKIIRTVDFRFDNKTNLFKLGLEENKRRTIFCMVSCSDVYYFSDMEIQVSISEGRVKVITNDDMFKHNIESSVQIKTYYPLHSSNLVLFGGNYFEEGIKYPWLGIINVDDKDMKIYKFKLNMKNGVIDDIFQMPNSSILGLHFRITEDNNFNQHSVIWRGEINDLNFIVRQLPVVISTVVIASFVMLVIIYYRSRNGEINHLDNLYP